MYYIHRSDAPIIVYTLQSSRAILQTRLQYYKNNNTSPKYRAHTTKPINNTTITKHSPLLHSIRHAYTTNRITSPPSPHIHYTSKAQAPTVKRAGQEGNRQHKRKRRTRNRDGIETGTKPEAKNSSLLISGNRSKNSDSRRPPEGRNSGKIDRRRGEGRGETKRAGVIVKGMYKRNI